jgi:nitrite reductase/ring-hydroxylating ferredoxin subunit/uncharacterized membrane protein
MKKNKIIAAAQAPAWVEKTGQAVQPAVLKAFEAGGKPGKSLKNFLHGVWLGHPLHPILTDIPIGAYTATAVLDCLELCGHQKFKAGSDASLAVGLAGAAGAAVTGITDWTGTSGQNRRVGVMHAALNVGATLLNTASLILRSKKSSRRLAIGCSLAAYAITSLAAYLGGHLVYDEHMGMDHTNNLGPYPLAFTDVLEESALPEGRMVCAKAGDIPVLLLRKGGKINALVNVCSHMGGPLNEGELVGDCCVKCPWHGSVFSVETGEVIEGPATAPQPKLETRIRNGKIQVRLPDNEIIKKNDTKDMTA